MPRTSIDWPILGLMLMTFISIWVTPDLMASLDKIVGLTYAIAVFYALVDWGQRRDSILPVSLLVVGLGTATALLSLVGTQWNVKWSLMESIKAYLPQMVSNLPGAESGFNPNTVSGTLITFVPLQLCLLGGVLTTDNLPRGRRRWLGLAVGLSLIPTGIAVLLAQSRAAWMALAIGLLCMAGILLKRFRLFVFLILVAVLIALLVFGPVGVSEWLVQQGWMTDSAGESWVARVERWSRWLWAISEYPLTGIGMDVFRWLGWEMYPFFHAPLGEDLGHAHSILLHTALDLGIPGLIFYLALLGGALAAGWQSYKQLLPRLTRLILLGGLVGLGTHAVWSIVDVLPLGARTNFLWWTVLALLIVVVNRGDQASPGEQEKRVLPKQDQEAAEP